MTDQNETRPAISVAEQALIDAKTVFTNQFKAEWDRALTEACQEQGIEAGFEFWLDELTARALSSADILVRRGMSGFDVAAKWEAQALIDYSIEMRRPRGQRYKKRWVASFFELKPLDELLSEEN